MSSQSSHWLVVTWDTPFAPSRLGSTLFIIGLNTNKSLSKDRWLSATSFVISKSVNGNKHDRPKIIAINTK